jgi:glutathione S-transferase
MEILDRFVSKTLWFVNENCTLADLAILSNVSQIKACGYDITKHANLQRWYQQCKALPGFEENEAGAQEVGDFFQKIVGKQF